MLWIRVRVIDGVWLIGAVDVLQRLGLEEKRRSMASPAGSDVVAGSSRSDSPGDADVTDIRQTGVYRPDTSSTGVYRPDTSSAGVYRPDTSSTGVYRSDTSSTGAYRLDTSSTGVYRPDTSSTGAYRPDTSSTGVYRPDTSSAGIYRPDTSSTGAYRPDTSSTGVYRPDTSSAGAYRPDTSSTGAYRPDTSLTGVYRPDTSSTGAYRPDTSSTGVYRPDPSSTGAYRPDTSLAGAYRSDVSRDSDTLLMAGRPFVAVTSRTRSPAVANSRPVCGHTRHLMTSPSSVAVQSFAIPSVTATSQSLSGVTCVSAADTSSCPPGEFQIAVATALPPAQLGFATLPTECCHDVSKSPSVTATSSVMARNSRAPTVMLQQVHSCEVSWPSAQLATVPIRPNPNHTVTRVTCDDVADSVTSARSHDTAVTPTPSLTRLTRDDVAADSVTHDSSRMLTATSRSTVNVSPLSHLSSESSSPSSDIPTPTLTEILPALPPPPYPGRAPVHSASTRRRVPPAPPVSDVRVIDSTVTGPAADDSTDEDVVIATECQRIESPRPIRRADHDNRCETKV